jgi:hypothetical protein
VAAEADTGNGIWLFLAIKSGYMPPPQFGPPAEDQASDPAPLAAFGFQIQNTPTLLPHSNVQLPEDDYDLSVS